MSTKWSQQGILTVISGFSGSGKGTVIKSLLKKYEYGLSISATSRKPRVGEEHGREYFFLTREEFESMIENNQLIEWTEYVGNYYGTPRKYVEEQLRQGKNVILEIEVKGAKNVKELFPEALLLFMTPPSAEELKNRLIGRGTESMEVIKERLSHSVEEATYMKDYDYIVINDDLEKCVEVAHQIIFNEHCKAIRSSKFIHTIQEELTAFKEGDI